MTVRRAVSLHPHIISRKVHGEWTTISLAFDMRWAGVEGPLENAFVTVDAALFGGPTCIWLVDPDTDAYLGTSVVGGDEQASRLLELNRSGLLRLQQSCGDFLLLDCRVRGASVVRTDWAAHLVQQITLLPALAARRAAA